MSREIQSRLLTKANRRPRILGDISSNCMPMANVLTPPWAISRLQTILPEIFNNSVCVITLTFIFAFVTVLQRGETPELLATSVESIMMLIPPIEMSSESPSMRRAPSGECSGKISSCSFNVNFCRVCLRISSEGAPSSVSAANT